MKPRQRPDGELYKRPTPNPWSESYKDGYADGFDGERRHEIKNMEEDYRAGYADGQVDEMGMKEAMDSDHSSNT